MSTKKTIAKSFTVSTIEDGVSVQAQYAPNANPTSGQIHTVWKEGDLYMRTRESDESAWSSWHKIVGESGDETDFSFGISAYKTTARATYAPSDISSWSDAPMAVTSSKPYLWSRVQKKVWDDALQDYVVDSTRYIRLTGEKGENAFVVDLENEMTNVALTEGGNTLTAVDFYFKVQAFYGTSNVLSDNECTVSASCSDSNVTLTTTAAKTTGIRVQVAQNVALANSTDITVTVTHTTYGTRTVVFTLAGVRGGENAILQELLPSLDTISFARQSDGSLTPASRNLDLSIKKTQGSQTIIQTISESGLTIRWSLSVMPEQPTSGSAWGQGTATGVTWSGNTMQIANSISAEHVCIAAFNSAGTLVDRETVPIVKDGQKGDDALTLVLDTYAIAFPTDSNYSVESQITYTVGARMYLGNSSIPRTITSLTASLDVADGDIDVSRTSPANGVVIDLGEARFANIIGVNVTAVCADGTRTAKIILTAAPKGENGTRGKIGRFFYFGGTFDSLDSTHTFVVNDAQAPYFEHTGTITTQSGTTTIKRYHVFNYDTNGTYTMSKMWTISSNWNNKPWESMTNDFKYLITEAIFGAYAHFGSFIINDDWMISQHGTINGQASPNYTQFDPDHPNDNTGTNFIPNFAVDGLTGKTYQNDAHVKGEIVSSSGNIGGFTINSKWLGNLGGTNGQHGWTYITKDGSGQFFNKRETNDWALRAYGKIELVGNGQPVTIANSNDSYIVINGRLQIVEGMLRNTEAGDVYVDTLGLLHVRGNGGGSYFVTDEFGRVTNPSEAYTQDGFRQINVVRGNCTLPNGCPVGTVYYVKGTGSTTVTVTNGSNDWIEGWDDNDNKGNSVGIQSNSVQFVKTATHIWTMFVGI